MRRVRRSARIFCCSFRLIRQFVVDFLALRHRMAILASDFEKAIVKRGGKGQEKEYSSANRLRVEKSAKKESR